MNVSASFPSSVTPQFCRLNRKTHLTPNEGGELWSRLRGNGYVPLPLKAETKQPMLQQWPLKAAQGKFQWMQSRPGIGLLCGSAEPGASDPNHPWRTFPVAGGLFAIDLDLNKKPRPQATEPTLSLQEQMEVRKAIGGTQTLRGLLMGGALLRHRVGAANFVVALRNDGGIKNGKWRFSRDGKLAVEIESLSSGRQFCAFAQHSAGAGPYLWMADRSPETVPLHELPILEAATLAQIEHEIVAALAPLGLTPETKSSSGERLAAKDAPQGLAAQIAADLSKHDGPALPIEEMADMLRFLAERNAFEHRDGVAKDELGSIIKVGWREAGMALKAAYGDEGFALWELTHIDDEARAHAPRQWASFASEARPGDVSVATLIKAARDAGFVSETQAPAPPIEPAPDVDPARYFRTDAGNALLFVAMFGENIRYIEEWKSWMVWDDKRWLECSDTAMLPLARAVTEAQFAHAVRLSNTDEQAKLRQHALSTQKEQRLRAMLNLAKGEAGIRAQPREFDADPWLLGCPNGVLDLRSAAFREARREEFITKSVAADCDSAAGCPNWLRFLEWAALGDRQTAEHLQRMAGYMLTGSVREEKLFALFGSGANGKTTFTATLMALMGDYAGKARKDLLMQSQGEKGAASPDVAALHGRRLVVISETDEGCTLAEAQVKEITSNETIAARRLHRDPFEFQPTHKVILTTNHRPFVKGTDEGIWRRLNIVGFRAAISEGEKDENFRARRLMPELSGILRWAVEGCLKWQSDGLKLSAAVKREGDAYRAEMDFIAHWMEDRCEQNAGANDFVPGARAYGDYEDWTRREHLPTLGRRRFGEELNARGFAVVKSNGVRGFRGLRIKPANMTLQLASG